MDAGAGEDQEQQREQDQTGGVEPVFPHARFPARSGGGDVG
jgi:hypothetical protein